MSDHNKTQTHCHAVKLTVRGLDRVKIAVKGIPVIATTDTGGNARVSDQENELGVINGLTNGPSPELDAREPFTTGWSLIQEK